MDDQDWAPYLRLQELYRACRIPELAKAIEGAMDRELEAILSGTPRSGTIDTAMSNHRRRERHRADLEGLAAPLMVADVDPWPDVDKRLDLERRIDRLDGPTKQLVLAFASGQTYADLAAAQQRPVGTVKAQIHRARLKMAA